MSPDIFQYFLDDFWNFHFFTKPWPFHLFFYVEMLQTIQENYGVIFKKYYFSYLNISEIPNFPNEMTLPDIKHVELIFSFLWWILDISWKSFKRKCLRSPKYDNIRNIFWQNIDFLMNSFEILIPPNRLGFPRLFG